MFLLMPYAQPEAAAQSLFETDLRTNHRAALDTIRCLTGRDDTAYLDPALGFNCFMWSSYLMRLVEYTEVMARVLVENGWEHEPLVQLDMTKQLREAAGESDQMMSWPWWCGNEDVHTSHKGFLISRDCNYRDVWPGVEPYLMPFAGLSVAHVSGI
jgi:hypothetical protein